MPSTRLIHDLVSKHARERPGACAVLDPLTGEEVDYAELWERSGGVAAELARLGVGPGDLVGVGQDRSVGMIVTFLGVLRAGAGYVPLDGMAPASRIEGILAEADIGLVICSAPDGPDLPPWRDLPDAVRRLPIPDAAPAGPVPEPALSTDDKAYVCYTSGSTGRPKGVIVSHRSVLRLALEPNFCTIGPGDRVANLANPAFDVTTFEVWNTLTAGGTVVVLPSPTDLVLDDWAGHVRNLGVDVMSLTTSLFHTVARELPGAFATVRTILVAGEQLDIGAARRVLDADPPKSLFNAYGPTEATAFASYFECTVQSLADLDRVPIGFPIQQTSLHLLGDDLAPVPPGEVGELCIGGPGVADGYLGRPELTADRFVTDPATSERLYRTGDMGRELPGGAIELLGRRDRQVKLRGFRVELAEIERSTVATGLADAAFVEKTGEGEAAALVGFVLPAKSAAPTGAELNRLLAEILPRYMLPARWIMLDEVPVNSTGKADRARLLASLTAPAAPNAVLDEVQRVWCEVLDVSDAQPADNFIELGGDSVRAAHAATLLQQRIDPQADTALVLLSDTLAELAAALHPQEVVSS